MCDKATDSVDKYRTDGCDQISKQPIESHMIYELKQKREYHIQQLVIIQKAIDSLKSLY